MTVLLRRTICGHLRGARPEKKSSKYCSEYTSGFSRPAALHLTAHPSPSHECNVGEAPHNLCRSLCRARCGP
jgi:hypothetical protein